MHKLIAFLVLLFAVAWLALLLYFLDCSSFLWLDVGMEQGGSVDLGSSDVVCFATAASAGGIRQKRDVVHG